MRLDKSAFHSVLEWEGYLEAGKTFPHRTAGGNEDYERGWRIREVEEKGLSMYIDVSAGKFEYDGERNCKYCESFDSIPHALEAFVYVRDYPWATMELVVEGVGGEVQRVLISELIS